MNQRYEFIEAEKAASPGVPVELMCRLLEVSPAGFYAWRSREPSPAQQRRDQLAALVHAVFERSERSYGYRRVWRDLDRRGIEVDDETIRVIMRTEGLVPVQEKAKRKGLTRPDKHAGPIPDLVARDFCADQPGAKLVGDITEIPTGEGPVYLATVLDCYCKGVVGYALGESYPAALVTAALEDAAATIELTENAIFHSDRGSQYTSHEFAETLQKHGLRQSVGRTGICYDNAAAESFFGKLKTEYINHHQFATRAEARRAVIWYINVFYNRRRLHSTLDYRPPFEILGEWLDNHKESG